MLVSGSHCYSQMLRATFPPPTGVNIVNAKENFLRVLEFREPQWIPFNISLAWNLWHHYREDLEQLVLRHPKVFRGFRKGKVDFDSDPGPAYRKGEYFRDNWGCVWYAAEDGLEGQVVESPLADWKALDTYEPPDLLKYTDTGDADWDLNRANMARARERGRLAAGYCGRLFDRLYFLRGFENLMIDIATADPHLPRLIDMLTTYQMRHVQQWLSLGVDAIGFHTDIGMQDRLMISPAQFRQHIKPMFKQIFQLCRNAGVHVLLSSDGRLVDIVDDLIECGVSRHDPQFRANTLAGIEKHYKGKLCINLDLDRQMFPFCQPRDLKEQVRVSVERLNLPEGGLMVFADVRDTNTSLANIEALCEAGEEYCLANLPD